MKVYLNSRCMTPDSNLQCNTTQRWQKAKWHTPGTQTTVQSGFPSQNSLAKFKQSVTFPPTFLPPPHLCCLLFLFKCSQVHGHAFLLCDEGGQVQREAVCVIQQPCRVTWKHRHRDEVFVWSNNEKKALLCSHTRNLSSVSSCFPCYTQFFFQEYRWKKTSKTRITKLI